MDLEPPVPSQPPALPEAPAPVDSTAELTPEQIEIITRRMNQGFYDTPEALEQIARRLLKDLGDSP
jgi:predicted DNA binding protein